MSVFSYEVERSIVRLLDKLRELVEIKIEKEKR